MGTHFLDPFTCLMSIFLSSHIRNPSHFVPILDELILCSSRVSINTVLARVFGMVSIKRPGQDRVGWLVLSCFRALRGFGWMMGVVVKIGFTYIRLNERGYAKPF